MRIISEPPSPEGLAGHSGQSALTVRSQRCRVSRNVRSTHAWGFIGRTSGKLEDEKTDNVYLISRAYQVYIPNLTVAYVRQITALPYFTPNHPVR